MSYQGTYSRSEHILSSTLNRRALLHFWVVHKLGFFLSSQLLLEKQMAVVGTLFLAQLSRNPIVPFLGLRVPFPHALTSQFDYYMFYMGCPWEAENSEASTSSEWSMTCYAHDIPTSWAAWVASVLLGIIQCWLWPIKPSMAWLKDCLPPTDSASQYKPSELASSRFLQINNINFWHYCYTEQALLSNLCCSYPVGILESLTILVLSQAFS